MSEDHAAAPQILHELLDRVWAENRFVGVRVKFWRIIPGVDRDDAFVAEFGNSRLTTPGMDPFKRTAWVREERDSNWKITELSE